MRVAVTGATGFVGSHVIRRLTASGHQVRILARRMPITALTPQKPLEVVLGDLDDQAALHRLVGGVDALIHVAGIIKARASMIPSKMCCACRSCMRRFQEVTADSFIRG